MKLQRGNAVAKRTMGRSGAAVSTRSPEGESRFTKEEGVKLIARTADESIFAVIGRYGVEVQRREHLPAPFFDCDGGHCRIICA